MLERELIDEAVSLLSTAIAELIEDAHPLAVKVKIEGQVDRGGRLHKVGEDVVALASAIRVLERRAAEGADHAD